MNLCILLTLSYVESDEKINNTVYIEDGSASVDLSCGEVPHSAFAIEWFIYKGAGWLKLLKFYHTNSGRSNHSNTDYTKYGISESVNTSLVINNIKLSDSALFKCGTVSGSVIYSHTTMLQVVGKLLQTCLFTSFPLVLFKTCNLLEVLGENQYLRLITVIKCPKNRCKLPVSVCLCQIRVQQVDDISVIWL